MCGLLLTPHSTHIHNLKKRTMATEVQYHDISSAGLGGTKLFRKNSDLLIKSGICHKSPLLNISISK